MNSKNNPQIDIGDIDTAQDISFEKAPNRKPHPQYIQECARFVEDLTKVFETNEPSPEVISLAFRSFQPPALRIVNQSLKRFWFCGIKCPQRKDELKLEVIDDSFLKVISDESVIRQSDPWCSIKKTIRCCLTRCVNVEFPDRRQKRVSPLDELMIEPFSPNDPAQLAVHSLIFDLIAEKLGAMDAHIFIERHYRGLTASEIATQLDISVKEVEKSLNKSAKRWKVVLVTTGWRVLEGG